MKNIEFWTAKMQLTDDHVWAYEKKLYDRRLRFCGKRFNERLVPFGAVDEMPAYPKRYYKDSWDVGAPYSIEDWIKRVLDFAKTNFWLRKALEKAFKVSLEKIYVEWLTDCEN